MSGKTKLTGVLAGLGRVAIDSAVFMYHFEGSSKYQPLARLVFDRLEGGKIAGVTSVVTVAEVFANKRVIASDEVTAAYRYVLEHWPGLTVAKPGIEAAILAGALRARYNLRLPDAFQVAAGLLFGAEVLITNDELLRRVKEPRVVILRDYLD